MNSLLDAFTYAFIGFIMLQINFVIVAIRSIRRNRHAVMEP